MIVTTPLIKNMVDSVSADGKGELPEFAKTYLGNQLKVKLTDPATAADIRDENDAARKRGDSSYFINPDLEYFSQETNPVLYRPLRFRELVDVTHDLPSGATSYTYRMLDKSGEAQVLDTLAGDAPDIDVFNTETTTGVKFVRDQYHWTIADLRSAAFAQKPLAQDKRQAAMDAIEYKLNLLAMGTLLSASATATAPYGGIFGWKRIYEHFGSTAAQLVALTTGTWSAASTAQILVDVAKLFTALGTNTEQNFGIFSGQPNLKLAVGHVHGARLKALQGPASGVHMSTWDAIMASYGNIPGFEIVVHPELHDSAVNNTDERIVAWHKDPRVIMMPISEYEEQAPQLQGWTWTIHAMASTTGIISRYPGGWVCADTAE